MSEMGLGSSDGVKVGHSAFRRYVFVGYLVIDKYQRTDRNNIEEALGRCLAICRIWVVACPGVGDGMFQR